MDRQWNYRQTEEKNMVRPVGPVFWLAVEDSRRFAKESETPTTSAARVRMC